MSNEELVKLFQETKDSYYLSLIIEPRKRHIENRQNHFKQRYGLDEDDSCSADYQSIWKATETYDPDYEVPFENYLNRQLSLGSKRLFHDKHKTKKSKELKFLSYDYDEETKEKIMNIEEVDRDLEQVEGKLDLQFMLKILNEEDAELAKVAYLLSKSNNYESIAQECGYCPENSKDPQAAQRVWTKRRVEKLKIWASNYYEKNNLPFPIRIRDKEKF